MKLCPACDRHLFGPEPTCPFCGAGQATTSARPAGAALASLTLAFTLGTTACGPVVEPQETNGSSSSADDDTGPPPPISTTSATSVTTGELTTDDGTAMTTIEASSSSDTSVDDGSCAFYAGCPPDVGRDPFECDVFAQDCPEGEKCMPWANDGGTAWNASRCSPVANEPDAPGEPCTVEGSAYSGIDSCELGAMCYQVDPITNEGTCLAMCTGNVVDPQCAAPEELCVIVSDFVPLCEDACQPLMPECAGGLGCYPSDGGFVCWWPTDTPGVYGEECDYVNACIPGHTCAEGASFPSCAGASCCTEFCDTAAGLTCPEADQGVTCVPWYDDGMAPPGYENVGVCTLPP